jgi:hypothetical protein
MCLSAKCLPFTLIASLGLLVLAPGPLEGADEEIRIIAGKTAYELRARPIEEGSVSLALGDSLLREGREYRVDLFTGTLTLIAPLPPGSVLTASYRPAGSPLLHYSLAEALPVHPRDSLSVNESENPRPDSVQHRERREARKELLELPARNLSVSGEKALSMELGSGGGTVLSQSLELSIGGKLAEGTDLRVYLSDSAMPLEREGSSKEVRELEKVSMSLESQRASATVGAYEFALEGYDLVTLRRSLEGFTGHLAQEGYSVAGSGAISGGEFTTNSFRGVEGKQGPYFLEARDGATGIVIVSSSERVYLDGRLLARGSRGDYTVNYNEGSVSFTDRNMITSFSRIEVEFEHAGSDYRRSFLATQGEVAVGKAVRLGGFVVRERDMEDSPLGGPFSEEDRRILGASEGGEEVLLPGGVPVGQGEGEYGLVLDERGGSHYEYVGTGSGNYHVEFTDVGEGNGDYGFDPSTGHFVYLGRGNGDNVAARRVVPPTANLTGGGALRWEEKGSFSLGGEGYFSSRDENTFSTSSGKVEALALNLGGSLEERELSLGGKGLGNVSMTMSERFLGEGFDVRGRLYEADFSRRWGLPGTRQSARENMAQAGVEYSWKSLVEVATGAGFLDRESGESSRRTEVSLGTSPLEGARLSLVTEQVDFSSRVAGGPLSPGSLRRTMAHAEKKVGGWLARAERGVEEVTGTGTTLAEGEGEKRNSTRAGLEGTLGNRVGLTLSGTSEHGERREGGAWRDWMRAAGGDAEVSWDNGGASHFSTHLAHRRTRFFSGSEETFGTTLGRLEYSSFPASGAHRTNFSYEVTSTARVSRTVAYVPESAPSEGEYLEDGTYVGKEEGTHVREVREGSDVGERIMRVSLSGIQSTDLIFLLPEKGSLTALLLTSTVTLVEENNALSDRGLFTFTSGNRFSREHSVYSENSVREELEFRWAAQGLSAKLEYTLSELLDNRYENLTSGSRLEGVSLFLKSVSESGRELGIEVGRGTERRDLSARSDRVKFANLAGNAGCEIARDTKLSLRLMGEGRSLEESGAIRILEVAPGLTRFFRSRGRIHAELALARVTGRVESSAASFLLRGKDLGVNAGLGVEGEYRIASSLLLKAMLSMETSPTGSGMRSRGNTELTYVF